MELEEHFYRETKFLVNHSLPYFSRLTFEYPSFHCRNLIPSNQFDFDFSQPSSNVESFQQFLDMADISCMLRICPSRRIVFQCIACSCPLCKADALVAYVTYHLLL